MAIINGTPGNDVLNGTPQADSINGFSGNDTLYGYAGNDTLIGGSGNDYLDGGSGNDFLNGYLGNDLYHIGPNSGYDTIQDISGNDTLDFSGRTDNLSINLATGQGALLSDIPTRVNTHTPFFPGSSYITTLSGGGYVVVWASRDQDGSGFGSYGQRFDAAGNKVGSEFQINTYTSGDQDFPSVAALKNGGFVVTWESLGQDGSGFGIYGQRYNASGNKVGIEFPINTYTNGDQRIPSVATLNNGDFVVTWESLGQDGNRYGVYGQGYDAFGNKLGGEFHINTATNPSTDPNLGNDQALPRVAALSNGGFVVVYSEADVSGDGIYGQRYDAFGNKVGTEFLINTYTNGNQDTPSVTALSNGGFVVTWESNGQDGSGYGIYGQRFDSSGHKVGTEFQANTSTYGDQVLSSVAALSNGGYVVTWSTTLTTGSLDKVYGQRFDASGNKVGNQFQISTNNSTFQQRPIVTGLSNGGFIVTWRSYADAVYSQTYDASGNKVGTSIFNTTPGSSIENVIGGSGNDYLVGTSGNNQLWGKGGNDTLVGNGGNDTLVGGSGNDLIYGGTGNDSYWFYSGFGNSTIQDAGGFDQIQFQTGISQNNIAFFRGANHVLQVGIIGSPQSQININNSTTTGQIERVQNATGNFLSSSNINTLIQEMSAYAAAHNQSFTSLQDVENNPALMAMINTAWHH